MKYRKEFMEWRHTTKNPELCPDLLPDHVETDPEVILAAKAAWLACERFYESRVCDGCRYFTKDTLMCDTFENCIAAIYSVDFSCKHWEAK